MNISYVQITGLKQISKLANVFLEDAKSKNLTFQ